jgi:FkbM family methyltransferase
LGYSRGVTEAGCRVQCSASVAQLGAYPRNVVVSRAKPLGVAELHNLYPTDLATLSRSDIEEFVQRRAQVVNLGDGIILARILTRYKTLLHAFDRGFACHLMMDGFWEIWLTQFFARTIKPGMRVVDVGANYGYYTLLFADIVTQSGHVLAVEPNPDAATLLQQSVRLNGFAGYTDVIEVALGATAEGTAQLVVPQGEPKNAHISSNPTGPFVSVATTNVDRLAMQFGGFDLIKIDAECSEAAIIDGMQQLMHDRPPALVLEFNARRCVDPAGFIDQLVAVYGALNMIDFDSSVQPVPVDILLNSRIGEDWMLYFPAPAG